MQWGLIPRTAKPGDAQRYDRENLFKNARAETLFEKWPWRMLWQHNRCIIPVTGFYEPHRLPNGKAQYYYTTLKDQELFSIAGLWDEWKMCIRDRCRLDLKGRSKHCALLIVIRMRIAENSKLALFGEDCNL